MTFAKKIWFLSVNLMIWAIGYPFLQVFAYLPIDFFSGQKISLLDVAIKHAIFALYAFLCYSANYLLLEKEERQIRLAAMLYTAVLILVMYSIVLYVSWKVLN